MDFLLTDDDKKKIATYIDSFEVKAVEYFDWMKRMIKYSDEIKGKRINEIKGDEEITRACLLTRLSNVFGYEPSKIELEHVYEAGRPHTNTSIIDVIVRDSIGNAFMFIEVKSPDAYATENREDIIERQLFKVAAMEQAERRKVKYLVLYTVSLNGQDIDDECIIIDFEKYPTYKDWEPIKECDSYKIWQSSKKPIC